ncbi:hypothetical protein SLEP1_g9486 [Rubroshorea leprosula]|nr:hypothetical protein SLEP1_g9486 [Rubroshorea leprosula]
MMPFGLGICFLCPSMDCLWHKYHYCPSCHQKVAEFEKSDPCAVVDVPQWKQDSSPCLLDEPQWEQDNFAMLA